jgi:hypothetical protein
MSEAFGTRQGEKEMYKDWLIRPISREEAEAVFINADWLALLDEMIEGDELWDFSSPPESWGALAGRAGIAVVRDDEIVNMLITRMN